MRVNTINLKLPDSFLDALKVLVPSVNQNTVNLLDQFQKFLLEANRRVNLTRIENELEFRFKHLLDSALLLYSLQDKMLKKEDWRHLMDFGTGGGIPGVPIAMMHPFESLTLVDARRKKLVQIDWILSHISWNVTAIKYEHASWQSKDARGYSKKHGCADLITARAVGPVEDLIKTLAPVCGNCLLLPRGPIDLKDWSRAENLAATLGFYTASLVDIEVVWRDLCMRRLIFQFFKKD